MPAAKKRMQRLLKLRRRPLTRATLATNGWFMSYVTRYDEIRASASHGMRARLRSVALDGLGSFYWASGRMNRALKVPRVQFLYIHHTFSDELAGLERLIKQLAHDHTFIAHSEAVDRLHSGIIDRPYIAFSSDDGFKNNLDGARLLHSYGIHACFFLNPGLIGLRDIDTIRRICAERLHLPPVEFLDWNEVAELQNLGHEIGSHSMEHRNMATTERESMREDLQKSLQILTRRCGPIKHFAFPYGRFTDITAEGFRDVFAAGYESCASAERGCHRGAGPVTSRTLCLRRDHVLLSWPLAHIRYFLANNALHASAANNLFPA